MKEFWSARIRQLQPYVPGEQPKGRKFIKLNTNENPYPPAPGVMEAIAANNGEALRLYPDPDATALRQVLADRLGVEMDQIFVGNGSDEVLAFAFQAFFDEGAEIVFPDVTYSFYPVYAGMFGVRYRTVPLKEDFTVDVAGLCGGNSGVVLANPNAPTGIALPLEQIEVILQANPDVVVLVDEAYVDFGGDSALALLERYPNLLVVQTFSKSRSLAGARIGFAVGSPNLIAALNCVKNSINSYTLDRLAIAAGVAAVEDKAYFSACCSKVIADREFTIRGLEELGFSVCPSKTNFVFATHPRVEAKVLFAGLRERGILVRYFAQPRIDNYLRISIGTHEEMEALLTAMAELTKEN